MYPGSQLPLANKQIYNYRFYNEKKVLYAHGFFWIFYAVVVQLSNMVPGLHKFYSTLYLQSLIMGTMLARLLQPVCYSSDHQTYCRCCIYIFLPNFVYKITDKTLRAFSFTTLFLFFLFRPLLLKVVLFVHTLINKMFIYTKGQCMKEMLLLNKKKIVRDVQFIF